MSWKLELGPVPRGLNVKAKRSWLETMMTIEPFALRVSVQRRPLSSVQGLAGHDGPESLSPDNMRSGRSHTTVQENIPTDSEMRS